VHSAEAAENTENRARVAITKEQATILTKIDQRTSEVIARAQAEVQNAVVLLCAGHVPEGSRFLGIEEDDAGAPQLVVQVPGATTSLLPCASE
jgi:hypothetical protein